MDEREILQKIGLSKNEADIYLCLLSNGTLSTYEIAQKTGIYRPHIYDKLETLMGKGLVSEIKKVNKKYFSAAHPNKIKEFLDQKKSKLRRDEDELEGILPQLILRNKGNKEDTNVEVYKGKEGLKGFLKGIIRAKKDACILGLEEEHYRDKFRTGIQKYFQELEANNLKERAMIKGGFKFNTKTTKYRTLKDKGFTQTKTETYIYGDTLGLVVWGEPITIIKIENKNMAKTYKEHFEYLWKIACK